MVRFTGKTFTRAEIMARLRAKVAAGKPILGAGAGTGLSAKCEELGGADLIVAYNTGVHRMKGRSSFGGHLPQDDSNAIVEQLANELLPMVYDTPVLAGVFVHEPYRIIEQVLDNIIRLGYSGVQNFPTFGPEVPFSFLTRQRLAAGYSYDNEVELVRMCNDKDIFTTPYVFTIEDAEKFTKAGADVIVVHLGGSGGGTATIKPQSLESACKQAQEIRDAVVAIKPDALVIGHGGPVFTGKLFQEFLDNTHGVVGFYGASGCERIPVENAIMDQCKKFKACKIKNYN